MGELLDRGYQEFILRACAEQYPRSLSEGRFSVTEGDRQLLVNASYLHEHGLLKGRFHTNSDGRMSVVTLTITARGLDFLQNDGGLSSILGVVTVKLHDDTIRQLLISKIEESDADPSFKDQLINAVKDAPADVLKSATQRALEEGIRQLPNALPLIQSWLNLL